jgi:D-glycero-D-manno-heptose 1,7-bisphosphate phosphatase
LITPYEARAVHERFIAVFAESGVTFDDVRYCFHAPAEACTCRKPSPQLLRESGTILGHRPEPVDHDRENKQTDVEAGINAGCMGLKFTSWTDLVAEVMGEGGR